MLYRRTIHELRRMFSGAVPLSKQERFAQAMVQLQEDKDNFAKQLKKMSEDRVAVEDKLACLNVQYAALQVSEQCRVRIMSLTSVTRSMLVLSRSTVNSVSSDHLWPTVINFNTFCISRAVLRQIKL